MKKALLLWSAIGLSVVCGIFVAYGVLTHTEPGLKNAEASWPKPLFPLKVIGTSYKDTHGSGINAADAKILKGAIEAVNDRLGFKALVRDAHVGAVTVRIGVPHDNGWESGGGHYELRGSAGTWTSCAVETSNTGTAELLSMTLQHELGHCLGLDHDPFDSSIMREEQKPRGDGAFPARFTDSDRSLLRSLYAP